MKRSLYLLFLCGLLLTGCRKDLCYDHETHVERVEYMLALSYNIEWEYNLEDHIDWEEYWNEDFGIPYDSIRPDKPEGVRVHVFDANGRSEIVRNLDTHGETLHFNQEGYHSMLFHNNDTEYIVYSGMESFSSAYATTRGVNRSSYKGNSQMTRAEDEVTVNPPDILFGAYMDSIYVKESIDVDTMSVTLHPLTFTYLIRYEIDKGAEHVVLARGALAGMARGVDLSSGHTSEEDATVLFDATVTSFGAEALVMSFGVPDYPNDRYTRNSRQYGLNLEVRLKDGSTQQFEFDITDQVAKQPHGGVIVVDDIEVEMKEVGGDTGGGGFDVGVEGWGDAIDIPLEL